MDDYSQHLMCAIWITADIDNQGKTAILMWISFKLATHMMWKQTTPKYFLWIHALQHIASCILHRYHTSSTDNWLGLWWCNYNPCVVSIPTLLNPLLSTTQYVFGSSLWAKWMARPPSLVISSCGWALKKLDMPTPRTCSAHWVEFLITCYQCQKCFVFKHFV